jgi:hypothetical protein
VGHGPTDESGNPVNEHGQRLYKTEDGRMVTWNQLADNERVDEDGNPVNEDGERYENAQGDMVTHNELSDAEADYYAPDNQDDIAATGIGISKFVKNYDQNNARDWSPSDSDDP